MKNPETGISRSEPHIQYLERWMVDRGFMTGHADNFTGLLEQLSTQIYELRDRLALAEGTAEVLDGVIAETISERTPKW